MQEIVIIKATRLQAWAPAGGGATVGRRPPSKKKFLSILGAFLLLFLHIGAFCYVFLIFRGLFTMWGPFCYFLLFLGLPPPTKISAGAHDLRRVQEHAPR